VLPWNSRFNFGEHHSEPENITRFKISHFPGITREVVVDYGITQEQKMIDDMCKIIKSGKVDLFWVEVALKTQLLLILSEKSAKEGVIVNVPKDLGI